MWSWIGGIATSFSIAAIGVRRYAPVTLRRHWFWTFCSGSSKLFAGVPPSSCTPHTWAPYSIAGRTVAVYRRREWRIDGPHVDVVILDIASKAAEPLVAAFLICFFHWSLGSTQIPRIRILVFWGAVLQPAIRTVDARSAVAWRRRLVSA